MSISKVPGSGAPTRTRRRRRGLTALSLGLVLSLAAACGGDDDDDAGESTSAPSADTAASTEPAGATGAGATDAGGSAPATAPTAPSEPADDGAAASSGGSLTMLRSGPTPATWDPADPSNDGMLDPGGTGMFLQAVYGVLAYEDPATREIVPVMAESITSEDGTTWTLTLRDGITFTDGTPYDAEAVKFNWERHSDPQLTSPHADAVAAIDSLTAVDATTLEVVLTAANTQFDRVVAVNLPFVGSPSAMADLDTFRTSPVGAGPFLLADVVAEQEATFARNPDYFEPGKPSIDELTLLTIADDEQRWNSFVTGQGQILQVFNGLSHVSEAEDQGYQVFRNTPGGGSGFMINHSRPPFDNLLARQAIAHIFDGAKKTDTLDFGVGSPVTNLFPEGSPYHDPSAELPSYDPAEGQRLLDEYAAQTGGPLAISMVMYEGVSEIGEFFQAQVQEFSNLDVSIELVAANEYVPTLAQGNFDIAVFPFTYGDPVAPFGLMLGSEGQMNFGRYSNPELDALLAEATAAATAEERAEIFAEVQRIFIEDVPYVMLFDNPDVVVAVPELQGLAFAGDGIPLWDGVALVG